jgi:hypothetical protein
MPIARGNQKADQTAKEVALQATTILTTQLSNPGAPTLPDRPHYSQEDLRSIQVLSETKKIDCWWYTGDHKIILPGDLAENLLHHIH